jgi:hypothetical protein
MDDSRQQVPTKIRPARDAITALIEAFCAERLNDEYRGICLRMLDVLARKRPTPLVNGKPNSWACGIVRAVGWVNFLDDSSQSTHVKSRDVDLHFGVSTATGQARSKQIRDLLKVRPFDVEWSLPSRIEQNPVAWLIQVNGLIVDARSMPRAVQEEAFRRGMIPFVPEALPGSEGDDETVP